MHTKQPLSSVLTSSFPEVARVAFKDKGGEKDVSVRVLQGLGQATPYLTPSKIRDLWIEYSQHDVLFSDYTMGKLEPFVISLINPRSFWFELFDNISGKAIGLAMLCDIIPQFDAKGHFAFWDRIGSGKEPLIWELMELCFQEFDLHRMSAETPGYQRGTIRTIKRLGFKNEGERTESVYYKGRWMNTLLFGITREEFERIEDERHPVRKRNLRDSTGDKKADGSSGSGDRGLHVLGGNSGPDGSDAESILDGSAGV